MRLIAHLVARNEADRYLGAVLASIPTTLIHLYDDCSTDDTVAVAEAGGAVVRERPAGVPTFLEHEGAFRQAAWESMEAAMEPHVGDWVLALDCDELVVTGGEDARGAIEAAIYTAQEAGAVGVRLPIPEIWDLNGEPQQRFDGFWAGLSAPRLFAYWPCGRFRPLPMGCGATPTYVTEAYLSPQACGLAIAHLGYADATDRAERYSRYVGRPGHNPAHIDSIRTVPRLGRVPFEIPAVRRGTR